MNFNTNLENMQNLCRICLKDGDINIWSYNMPIKQDPEIYENSSVDEFTEKSFVEIMNIFFNSQDLLNFTEEFPLLCHQCLQDLKFCYSVYEKIKLANIQLINLYQESLNQYIEEEHLVETIEGIEDTITENSNIVETMVQYSVESVTEPTTTNKTKHSKLVTLDKNNSFIVTQFIPESFLPAKTIAADEFKSYDEESRPPQNLLTVNLKAVEVQNLENIDRVKSPEIFMPDTTESTIYACQYCPLAFTKPEYLKTHIQKSHVCKFCTQPFSVTEDLFSHIRETHTENKCAICQKLFSSGTNLRHHIKRVHGIKLPAKVTLIDFIQAANNDVSETELFEVMGASDIEHLWQSDNCIDILNENKSSVN